MMKKLFLPVLSIMLSLSMAACDTKSPEEKAYEDAVKEYEEAKQRAQEAKDNYNDLKNALEEYEQLKEQLK